MTEREKPEPYGPHRARFLEIAQEIRRTAESEMSFEEALGHAYALINSGQKGETVQ